MNDDPAWPTASDAGTQTSSEPGATPGATVEVGRLFLAHKLLLVIAAAAGTALGYYKFTRAIPEYASVARVLVARDEAKLPVEGMERVSARRDPIGNHIALMTTPVILTKAVEEHGLASLESLRGASDPVAAVAGKLSVTRGKDSGDIIDLSYRCSNRSDCQTVLNAVIAAYVDFVIESQESINERSIAMISRAKDDLLEQLRDKEAAYQEFRDTTQLVFRGEDSRNIHQERLAAIEGTRVELRLQQSTIRAELGVIEREIENGRDPDAILMMALRQLPEGQAGEKEAAALAAGPNGTVAETEAAAPEAQEPEFPKLEPLPAMPTAALAPIVDTPVDKTRQQLMPLLVEEQRLAATRGKDHPDLIAVRREIALTKSLLEEELAAERRAAAERQARLEARALAVEEARRLEIERRERLAREMEERRAAERLRIEEARRAGEDEKSQPDVLATYVGSLETQLSVLDSKLGELDGQYKTEEVAARVVAIDQNRDRVLREDIQRVKRLFDVLFEELQEASLIEGGSFYAVEPVSSPTPAWQVAPKLLDNLLLGGLLGLLGGLGLSYWRESADRSFRGPEQIASMLGVRVIGHIPQIQQKRVSKESGLHRSLVAFHRPKSRFSEAYRAVRVPLLFGSQRSGLQVVQVTSPDPGDGKSTLAANLALVMASSGKRVILVDCDFRRPTVHKLFGAERVPGLAEVILDEAELSDAIRSDIGMGLDVMCTGVRPSNVAEMLLNPRFDETLELLRQKYDFVFLDSPPVLAVTDASALAAKVDSILLTMRVTKRVQVHASQTCEILKLVDANILGVVVNAVGGSVGRNYGTGIFSSKSSRYQYTASPGYGKYYSNYNRYYGDNDGDGPVNGVAPEHLDAGPAGDVDSEDEVTVTTHADA